MNQIPKVSMLVPIYGVEKFIERCAISLFEQTYQNIEYIFVNDSTKDNSINILEGVINRYPNRKPFVRIINHTPNKGLAGARNTAVANATGEFIMHVDSDDYVDKEIVRKAIDKQLQSDADIVIIDFKKAYPGFYKITKYASFGNSEEYCLAVLARKNSNSIWAKLIRRSLYVDNSIKCIEGCNQGEDFQVVPFLLYYAKKIVNLTEPLYYYDCSNEGAYSNSFTISKHDQNWESMNMVQSFFEHKESAYRYAVDCGRLRQIADDLIISAKTHGEVSVKYYHVACLVLKSIKRDFWNTVPLEKRIILYLSPYYKLMVIYILLFRKIHHLIMMIKSGKND